MGLVLQPVDQGTERVLSQQLVCWARTATGMIDPRVVYQSCCVSVTEATLGRWAIPAALCDDYGPLPFTAGGNPIPCNSAATALSTFMIYPDDVDAVDPNTCESAEAPLPPPTGLTVSAVTDNSFVLDWDAVTGSRTS